MKKTLLALACAAMATASIQAESVTITNADMSYPNMGSPMAMSLKQGEAKNVGFGVASSIITNSAAGEIRIPVAAGAASYQMRYFALNQNTNAYYIETVEITYGTTTVEGAELWVSTSDKLYTSANLVNGTEVAFPVISDETIEIPVDNTFFALYNPSGGAGIIPIKEIKINYSVGAQKEDPAWVLVNPGNQLTVGDTFTPELDPITEGVEMTYTLKFSSLTIKANEDGSFTLPYSGTYTLIANSAVNDTYNAKEMSVTFNVANQISKWEIVEPTGLKEGDKWKPEYAFAPESGVDVVIEVSYGTTKLSPDAEGYYTLAQAGTYSVSAESEANNNYAYKSQKFSFTVDKPTGVETIDLSAPATYYTLQGLAVKDLTPGLYIMKQGNKVSKVIVR